MFPSYHPCRHKKVTSRTVSLCLAAVTHSFLLFSFFPYAGYMAVYLLGGGSLNVDNVGPYAGLLGAAFTFGRFLGFLPWKLARRRLGERRALALSLALTGAASVGVGAASTFAGAVTARLLQGLSDCISGCVKRAAMDSLAAADTERRSAATGREGDATGPAGNPEALVLSVMWWGAAFGPVVGGILADSRFFDGAMGSGAVANLPYLGPALFGAFLCLFSFLCVAAFVTDAPAQLPGSALAGENRQLLPNAATHDNAPSTPTPATPSLWSNFLILWRTNKAARYHLVAYWSFSFVVVCTDEALPLFLITSKASTGLGLSEGQVGALLSAAGLAVAINHHLALERLFDVGQGSRDGIYRILGAAALLGSIPATLVPLALPLNNVDAASAGVLGLSAASFAFLVALVAFLRGAAGLYFSFVGMAIGRTLRVVHKDEAARVMTAGALLARSAAPVVAGAILARGMRDTRDTASLRSVWTAWIVIGLLFGLISAVASIRLARQSGDGVLTGKQRAYILKKLQRTILDGSEREKRISNFSHWMGRPKRSQPATRKGSFIIDEGRTEEFKITWAFILGTHQHDSACTPHVLTLPLMNALRKHLPTRCTESNFWLRYSLLRDGASHHSMEAKAGLAKCTIMAIETLNGEVFGCFMTNVRT